MRVDGRGPLISYIAWSVHRSHPLRRASILEKGLLGRGDAVQFGSAFHPLRRKIDGAAMSRAGTSESRRLGQRGVGGRRLEEEGVLMDGNAA